MIQTIKIGVDIICSVIHHSLYISCKIGHFLVNIINILQNIIPKLIYLLVEVFSALFESFTTFFQDVFQNFQNVLRLVSSFDIVTNLSDVRNIIVQAVVFVVTTLSDVVAKLVLGAVTGIHAVLLTPKYVLLYLMKNIWYIISGIRGTLNDLTAFFIECIHFMFQNAKDLLITGVLFWINLPKTIYDFVTDIPTESIVDIMVSCCIIYVFVRFYVIFISFISRQLRRFFRNMQLTYNKLCEYFTRSSQSEPVIYRRQIIPSRRPQIRAGRSSENSRKSEDNDRYCVICQEHVKSILLLPCRHLCMCRECIDTLQMYHNTCPICRSDIERTMQIYV